MIIMHIVAPFDGWASGLDGVSDPVFADGMMGDGIAVEPLGNIVCAPCDGVITALAPTLHSVSMTLANGADLLIHVGIDTVALGGSGFVALVAQGALVTAGTPLLQIDLDRIMRAGNSLATPIVVMNDGYEIMDRRVDQAVRCGELLFDIRATDRSAKPENSAMATDRAHCDVLIGLANGIHARPAARIVQALKPFEAEVFVAANGKSVNARSMVGLLGLGLRHGDSAAIKAMGSDARAAVAALVTLIETGMGEDAAHPAPTARDERQSDGPSASTGPLFQAVSAAPGFASGPAFQFAAAKVTVDEYGAGIDVETAALCRALDVIDIELTQQSAGDAAGIADAHRALLHDPDSLELASREIASGRSAAFAWQTAMRASADILRGSGDARMIERIADLSDIEYRVIAQLSGGPDLHMPQPPAGAIVLADELLPSQFLALQDCAIAGICTARGGPTSHVAILSGAAAIPMLVAAGPGILSVTNGQTIILDAQLGTLDTAPDAETLADASARAERQLAVRTTELAAAGDDCFTTDGTRIEVFANLASLGDAHLAVESGAEGCGLLRTEFLFLDRIEAPGEEEQRVSYAAIAAAMNGRPLIVRTLDIGGDKPVPYLPFDSEDNPALGARGIRMGLARPDMLATQLRAIVAGIPARQCRIMLPMIVDRDELALVREMLDAARLAVGCHDDIPLGVMIETPAAALLAESIAANADFLSIGTNDLTQYTLAADRGNPAVAARVDALHPAVLRLIAAATAGAATHGRWVGVCGALASDPRAAALLIGLGVTELSVSPASVPAIKAVVRMLDMANCRALAQRALTLATACDVRALLGDI